MRRDAEVTWDQVQAAASFEAVLHEARGQLHAWGDFKRRIREITEETPSEQGEALQAELARWLQAVIGGPIGQFYSEVRSAPEKLQKLRDIKQGLQNRAVGPEDVLRNIDAAFQRLSTDLHETAPTQFSYKGITVENPYGFSDAQIAPLLDAIGYLTALFKSRGVGTFLTSSLRFVSLVVGTVGERFSGVAGSYSAVEQRIEVPGLTLRSTDAGRMLKSWVHEVLLHEMGHHLHRTQLPKDASAFWNKPWEAVKDNARWLRNLEQPVAPTEAHRFWNMLVAARGNLPKVRKKLPPETEIRLHLLLAANGLVSEKQLMWLKAMPDWAPYQWDRLTGKMVADLLANPEAVVKDKWRSYDKTTLETVKARVLDGVTPNSHTKKVLNTYYMKTIDTLEVPTDYAKTNAAEDFAESFVAFLDAPEKLSETAMFRMKRTLSLAGLYGKPVMRVARRYKLYDKGQYTMKQAAIRDDAVPKEASNAYNLARLAMDQVTMLLDDDVAQHSLALLGAFTKYIRQEYGNQVSLTMPIMRPKIEKVLGRTASVRLARRWLTASIRKLALKQKLFKRLMEKGADRDFGILSGYGTGEHKSKNQAAHGKLMAELSRRGYKTVHPVRGKWEGIAEQAVLVPHIKPKDLYEIGKMFDQVSVIHKSADGVVGMYYLRDNKAEVAVDPKGLPAYDMAEGRGLYSKDRNWSFSLNFLWGQKLPWDGKTPITSKKVNSLIEDGTLKHEGEEAKTEPDEKSKATTSEWWKDQTKDFQQGYCEEHPGSGYCK